MVTCYIDREIQGVFKSNGVKMILEYNKNETDEYYIKEGYKFKLIFKYNGPYAYLENEMEIGRYLEIYPNVEFTIIYLK